MIESHTKALISDLKKRTKEFAHHCVKLTTTLPSTNMGRHIGRQLIRCATSVAANYRAACVAQSKAHFTSKLSTVIEEVDECCFWIEFLVEENLLSENRVSFLLKEAKELTAIFMASRKTTKNRTPEFVENQIEIFDQ
jgi:four helix bundle protein